MNPLSSSAPGFPMDRQGIAPVAISQTRPLYWSVRRELWENRSIYLAPLAVAAVVLFGFVVSTIGLPHRRRAALLLDPAHQRAAIAMPYDIAATMIILTAILIGVFYCLDALHGERRDRSILFWKSLPVSDLTTVLSKAAIPLVVLPPLSFVIIALTQLIMFLQSSMVLLVGGLSPETTWKSFNLFEQSLILAYSLITLALWHAPIYAWLLLVSSWARRATFLWAALPLLAIGVLEKIAFNTRHFASFVQYRFMGHMEEAFTVKGHGSISSLAQLTPVKFLGTPGLWLGLIFAAGLLAAAVRLRRYRDPN